MFRHEGPARDMRKNAQLAGYLAFVAGFVNSGGFVMIGSFTSHVTGSVGRLGNDIAMGEAAAALWALMLVLAFFGGAFVATLFIEGHRPETRANAYAAALLAQGGLLSAFIVLAGVSQAVHPRVLDAEATILCFSLGMQNSLVTRLSGAVVRTTHLTGVVTDLAIEAARWYRWHRSKLRALPAFLRGRTPPERPMAAQSFLLSVIVVAFTLGGVAGAVLTLRASRWAMVIPAVAVLGASAFAYAQGKQPATLPPPRP